MPMRINTGVWGWVGWERHSSLAGFQPDCPVGGEGRAHRATLLLWLWLQENSGQQNQVTVDAPSDHGVYSFQFNK